MIKLLNVHSLTLSAIIKPLQMSCANSLQTLKGNVSRETFCSRANIKERADNYGAGFLFLTR
jgi:hypothetical protein